MPSPARNSFVACAHDFAATPTNSATFFCPHRSASLLDNFPSAVTRTSRVRVSLGGTAVHVSRITPSSAKRYDLPLWRCGEGGSRVLRNDDQGLDWWND